jgi:translation initiation factor 1
MRRREPDRPIVYSSEHGRMCPKCGKPTAKCTCTSNRSATPGDGIVRISRETKGRRGKSVTLVTGVPLDGPDLQDLARQLKQRCGTGGTLKDGVIEIQGDHRDTLVESLTALGYKVKRSGG